MSCDFYANIVYLSTTLVNKKQNMARQVTLRQLKQKMEKTRITAAISNPSYTALVFLMEQEPDLTISQVVSDCIRFAHSNSMYEMRQKAIPKSQEERQNLPSPKPVTIDKKSWCEQFGGVCDGVNCTFKKYEVTPTGVVVRNELTMPVRTMPETEVEFRKYVLGGFINSHEAQVAFESQVADDFFDPSEIPSRKRVKK